MTTQPHRDPLHGVTLEQIVTALEAQGEFGEVCGSGWGKRDRAVGCGFDELKHEECKSGDGHVVFGGRLVFR